MRTAVERVFEDAKGAKVHPRIFVMNGAQRCEMHNRAVCRWVGWELLTHPLRARFSKSLSSSFACLNVVNVVLLALRSRSQVLARA